LVTTAALNTGTDDSSIDVEKNKQSSRFCRQRIKMKVCLDQWNAFGNKDFLPESSEKQRHTTQGFWDKYKRVFALLKTSKMVPF